MEVREDTIALLWCNIADQGVSVVARSVHDPRTSAEYLLPDLRSAASPAIVIPLTHAPHELASMFVYCVETLTDKVLFEHDAAKVLSDAAVLLN